MTDTQKLEAIKAEIERRKNEVFLNASFNECKQFILNELQHFIAFLDEQSENCDTANENWSEDDEKMYKSALWHISNSATNGKSQESETEVTNWLKHIKERLSEHRVDKCTTCTNDKGCVTCENGELYEGKPAEFKKKLIIIMDSKEGDTKHICNQKSCPFFSKTEDGDMGILCKKLWATPPKGKSSLASLCNYYDVQNLTIAEAEGCETINQILELSEQHPTDYTKSNEEKALEIAKSFSIGELSSTPTRCYQKSALEMAQWKDRQFKAEKQQLIDKACELLKDMACYYAYWEYNGDTYEKEIIYDTEKLIKSFKKAMEEGEE